MIVYVCKNHDADGDLHISVFSDERKADQYCRAINTAHPSARMVYYPSRITDDIATETHRYNPL